MPGDKIPLPQFAAKIKEKYPQYKDMDDTLLVEKILAKYPQYSEQVDFPATVKKKQSGGEGFLSGVVSGVKKMAKDAFGEFGDDGSQEQEDPAKTLERDLELQFKTNLRNPELTKSGNRQVTDPLGKKQTAQESFDAEKEYLKNQIKTNPIILTEYNKNRLKEVDDSIRKLEEKEGAIAYKRGQHQLMEDNEEQKSIKNEIAQVQKYKSNLRRAVTNQAADIALKKYIDNINEASPRDVGRAIVKMADPDFSANVEMLEQGGRGLGGMKNAELERLGLDAIKYNIEKFKDHPNYNALKQRLEQDEAEFAERNFEFTGNKIREKIGQVLRDEGDHAMFGFGYKEKKIREAFEKTNPTEAERKVFEKYVLPVENKVFGTGIPTGGFTKSFYNAFERSGTGMANTFQSIIGERDDLDRLQETFNDEGQRWRAAQNRSGWQKFVDGTGDLTGQVANIAVGTKGVGAIGKGLKSATGLAIKGLSNEVAGLTIMGYVNSYDNYRQQALVLFPGSENKAARQGYANTMAIIEGLSGRVFRDTKVFDAFKKGIAPTVREIVQKGISGQMTKALAEKKLKDEIKSFGKQYIKATTQESSEEALVSFTDNVAQAVFGDIPFDYAKAGRESVETFLTTALHSGLVSGMSAYGAHKQNKSETAFLKTAILNMAKDPSPYLSSAEELKLEGKITQEQYDEKVGIIKKASEVFQQMPEGMDAPKAASYLVNKLNGDERSEVIAQGVVDGTIQVNDDLVEETNSPQIAEELGIAVDSKTEALQELENALPNIKGMWADIAKQNPEQFLDVVAQQALSLTEDGKKSEVEGLDSETQSMEKAVEQFGKPLVDAAINYYNNKPQSNENIQEERREAKADVLEVPRDTPSGIEIAETSEIIPDQVQPPPSKKRAYGIYKQAENTDVANPRGIALKYFATGGNINPSVVKDLFGEKSESEKRSRIGMLRKNGPTIDQIAHQLWEENSHLEYTTQDYKNAIEEAILSHNSRGSAAKELVGLSESVKNELTEEEAKHINDKAIERLSAIVDGIPQEQQNQLIDLLRQYQDQYGFIDWERLEKDNNGFEPIILNLPSETQDALNDIIQKNINSGQGELGDVTSESSSQEEATAEPTETGSGQPPITPTAKAESVTPDSEEVSGIKKALVSDEVIKGVDVDKTPDKEMMAAGRKILDSGEVNPEAIINKINREGKGVLTPAEVVALITYKADLDNQLRDAYKAKNNGDENVDEEINDLERKVNDFDVMAVITASQQSMAFRLRKMLLDRDYNIITQVEKYKANNGGEIPKEIEEKFQQLDRQLKDVKEKLAEAEKREQERQDFEAFQNIQEEAQRQATAGLTEQQVEEKVKEGVQKEIEAIRSKLPTERRKAADKAIAALERMQKRLRGKNYSDVTGMVAIVDAGITTIKNAIKAGVAIADAIELGIGKIKDLLKEKGVDSWEKESEFRQDMIDGFASEGVESKKKTEASPYIDEDGKLRIPNKMIRDLVGKKGINDINDLTKIVHAEVVKILPNATERQVRDIITEYGKQVNPTKDKIQQQINTAKRIGRLISELEDAQAKKRKSKAGAARVKLTEREKELKRQIKTLLKTLPLSDQEQKAKDDKNLEANKERVRRIIDELNDRIKRGDYSKKQKKAPATDPELIRLQAEKEKIQHEFDREQYKNELKNRGFWKKAEDVALELLSGLPRALVASIDFSASLVQGLKRWMTSPRQSFKALMDSFRAFASDSNQDKWMAKIKAQPWYPTLEASKLALTSPDGKHSQREELFISDWVNVIYNFFAKLITFGYQPATEFVKKINPYKATSRAYNAYLNSVRVSAFLEGVKYLEQSKGVTFESHPESFKKWADYVNTNTGRASLGAAETSSKMLSIFFFAPRKVVSDLKLFTPYAFVYYARMPKDIRMKAVRDYAQFISTLFVANALVWAARKDWDDDEEKDDFWNPTSTNFLTHKYGNTRIEVTGGVRTNIVFMARLFSGKYTDQYGETTNLGERFGKKINTRGELAENFFTNKLAPVPSLTWQKLDERKGLEIDPAEMAVNASVPMWLQDVTDLYKENPRQTAAMFNAMAIFGASVRVMEQKKEERLSLLPDEVKEDYLKDKNDDFLPPKVQSKMSIGGQEIKLEGDQVESYKSLIDTERKRLVSDFVKSGEYEFLTDNQKIKALDKLYDAGRKIAQQKFLMQNPSIIEDVRSKIKSESDEEQKAIEEKRKERESKSK